MGKVASTIGKTALGMVPGGNLLQAGLGLAGGLIGAKTNAFQPKISSTQNAASPMAGNYANFLNSMMGGQQGAQGALQNMLAGRPGDPSSLQQYFGAGMGGNGQADLSGVNPAIQPINVGYTPQDIQSQFNPQQIGGQFDAPQFNAAQLNQLDPISAQQVGFSAPQFQNAQLNSLNLQNLGREALATGPNMMQGFGERGNFGSVVNPEANAAAMQQVMGGVDQRNIADLRERFGNQGLSTGAAQAEGLYRAEAAPRQALAIDEITRANQAQQLQQRGQDIGAWQAGRGFDVQQLGMGGDQSNALNQSLIAQRGQDVSQMGLQSQLGLGMNDQQLQAAQMANQFGMQGAGMGLQADQANQNAMLQSAGMNQQGQMDMNQLLAQLSGQQNQFNQGNAQFGANFGQNAAQLNNQFSQNATAQALQAAMANQSNQQNASQQGIQAGGMNNDMQMQLAQLIQSGALNNQQMGNQWNLGLQNIGLGQQQNQAQAQQAALAQLFGGFNNMGQIGMPQAETVVGPSQGQNFAGRRGAMGGLMDTFNKARAMNQPQATNMRGAPAPALPPSSAFNLAGLMPKTNQALALPAYFGGR